MDLLDLLPCLAEWWVWEVRGGGGIEDGEGRGLITERACVGKQFIYDEERQFCMRKKNRACDD